MHSPSRVSVGALTEGDVELAAGVGATVVGFNMAVPSKVATQADQAGVTVHSHRIIYQVVDAVKDVLEAAIPPVLEDV
eukprot:688195-Prymnesium_polylepis.1